MTPPRAAYLDHAAGWPPDPRILAAMADASERLWASAEGVHAWSTEVEEALGGIRADLAALVVAAPDDVILCGGSAEARSLAFKGALAGRGDPAGLVLTTAAEHPAGLALARSVNRARGGPRIVGVDRLGRVDPEELAGAIDEETALVALTLAQPEIGTVQDVPALVEAIRTRRPDVLVHLDAADSVGLVPIDLRGWSIDLLTVGGLTLGAPAWCGALLARPGVLLGPLVEGGAQERGKRAGAQDVAGAAAIGLASRITRDERAERVRVMAARAEELCQRLLAIDDVRLNGPREGRLPGNLHVCAGWVDGESLAVALAEEGVAVSPGSACTAAAGKAAPILEAIGLELPWTRSGVLLSTGPTTTEHDVAVAADAFARCLSRLRAASPIGPRP